MRVSAILASVLPLAASAIPTTSSATAQATAPALSPWEDDPEVKCEVGEKIEEIRNLALSYVNAQAAKQRAEGVEPTCTAEKLVFRREYGSLSKEERLDYINAVKCLQHLPANTPPEDAAGAKSRFDDFIMVHINQTGIIHFTGNFQPWHRWFTYQYEKALREECGYQGYQPYWDWPKYAAAPQDSPIFDGSPYSMGGNGEYIPHEGITINPLEGTNGEPITLPPGVGGGYVTTGPFADMAVNLGPFEGLEGTPPGPDGGLGYNPRRLKRDVNPTLNRQAANYSTVEKLLRQPDIASFRRVLEGVAYTPDMGPHGNVHYVISGDPGADLFTSPGDPVFYLHHGMMDRMWAYWQIQNTTDRFTEEQVNGGLYGHITWANSPKSRKAKFDDPLDMLYAGESSTIGEVMNTMSGPFCYFYL